MCTKVVHLKSFLKIISSQSSVFISGSGAAINAGMRMKYRLGLGYFSQVMSAVSGKYSWLWQPVFVFLQLYLEFYYENKISATRSSFKYYFWVICLSEKCSRNESYLYPQLLLRQVTEHFHQILFLCLPLLKPTVCRHVVSINMEYNMQSFHLNPCLFLRTAS